MDNTQQTEPAPAHGSAAFVKLPPFWPHAPALWFSQIECLFHVKQVTDQFQKYCHVVGSLPHESLRQVADIVEAPPAETPYVAIKQRLMAAHQMTSFQRAEKLFAMPALGNRKPSELMAAMLEICPRGEEKTDLFACLFLQRLPREIRILLADADHKDPKLLAEKADQLWGHHSIEAVGISVVQEDDGLVAAMRSDNGGGRGRGGRGGRGNHRRGRGAGGGTRAAMAESDISKEARLAAGLCLRHWRYGDQAHGCEQPCAWPGNATAGGN
jgi:hypothetical protein